MTAPHQIRCTDGNNPGETLRIAHEEKGWPLAAVALQLNLTERLLARIEAGDFSQLPGTPCPGLRSCLCQVAGLDQNRLAQEFDLHRYQRFRKQRQQPASKSPAVCREASCGSSLCFVAAPAAVAWYCGRNAWLERPRRHRSRPWSESKWKA
ncbi:helix-turn-helix domain-containing protein [Stutzerimonas xanthomarina]|uniref:helix-turn-helix domain-containing protein n=1 Tax=Stutzerimonas xanthomarina TaxID=271420 RepID=UPI003AA90D70